MIFRSMLFPIATAMIPSGFMIRASNHESFLTEKKPPSSSSLSSFYSISQLAEKKSKTNKKGQFTEEDVDVLSFNENFRYAKNSKKSSHAVICRDADGTLKAWQYPIPKGSEDQTPEFCTLSEFEEIRPYGMVRYKAKGSDGKTWYAKRYDHGVIKQTKEDTTEEKEFDLAYFSEGEDDKTPFWGSKKSLPRFPFDKKEKSQFKKETIEITKKYGYQIQFLKKDQEFLKEKIVYISYDLDRPNTFIYRVKLVDGSIIIGNFDAKDFSLKSEKILTPETLEEFKDQIFSILVQKGHTPISKGGPELLVDGNSVVHRDANPKRHPTQNAVMTESARDAYENFYKSMKEELSPEISKIMQRSYRANIRKAPQNQYRPEWLHLYGFSLTPKDQDPQTSDNLGAAPKWANTEMMILERIAKWFALNKPEESSVTIKTRFDMIRDSEIIDHIHFEVSVSFGTKELKFIQSLDPFLEYPLFRKASDLAHATAVTYALLSGLAPASVQAVKEINHPAKPFLAPTPRKTFDLLNLVEKIETKKD